MFEKMIDICRRNDICIEFAVGLYPDEGRIRIITPDGYRLERKIVEISNFDDLDKTVLECFIPMMLAALERYRKEHKCV